MSHPMISRFDLDHLDNDGIHDTDMVASIVGKISSGCVDIPAPPSLVPGADSTSRQN